MRCEPHVSYIIWLTADHCATRELLFHKDILLNFKAKICPLCFQYLFATKVHSKASSIQII